MSCTPKRIMAAIENLMKRWGFVRLSRYGLVLTPEGRIMSLRPVLDDGMGGPVVGWRDRDLAAAELGPWEPARPASARAVASPVAVPPTAVRVSPPVAARTISPLLPVPTPPPAPIAQARAANYVAPAAEPEEDEWAWEIALARARGVAVDVVTARPPAPVARPSRRNRDTVPPPAQKLIPAKTNIGVPPPPKFIEVKTTPMATVAPDRTIDSGEWPKTEPLGHIDFDDRTSPMNEVVRAIKIAQMMTPPAVIPAKTPTFARAASPSTVIPIPKLPRAIGPSSMEPVVRTRFPKATPPVATQPRPHLGIAPPPPVRPAEDDKTSPGISIAMPQPARVVGLPRIPSVIKRAR